MEAIKMNLQYLVNSNPFCPAGHFYIPHPRQPRRKGEIIYVTSIANITIFCKLVSDIV